MTIRRKCQALLACMALLILPVQAMASGNSVYMEDLTWEEIRDKVRSGVQVAIVPTGGIEQGGPHLVTGKQNMVIRYTSGRIAQAVNGLVAPVVNYVPEGRIDPPHGHMRFAGTVSIDEQVFGSLLQNIAESLKEHGFRYICFIGEHGGSQRVQKQIASRLSSMWHSEGVRVINVSAYQRRAGQEEWNKSTGLKVFSPHAHAGHIETSEMMVINPGGVRDHLRRDYREHNYKKTGAMGGSHKASAEYGRRYIGLKQEAAIEQIKYAIASMQ